VSREEVAIATLNCRKSWQAWHGESPAAGLRRGYSADGAALGPQSRSPSFRFRIARQHPQCLARLAKVALCPSGSGWCRIIRPGQCASRDLSPQCDDGNSEQCRGLVGVERVIVVVTTGNWSLFVTETVGINRHEAMSPNVGEDQAHTPRALRSRIKLVNLILFCGSVPGLTFHSPRHRAEPAAYVILNRCHRGLLGLRVRGCWLRCAAGRACNGRSSLPAPFLLSTTG
jgi:hypothetical protein